MYAMDTSMALGLFIILPLVALAIGAIVLLVVLVARVAGGNGRKESLREETRMIQEMYSELSGLVSRVETLETLLLDSHRKAENSDNDVQR